MRQSYLNTRSQLEAYFDRTAAKTWTALTSDAPVSRIRQTVREGRDQMRNYLLHLIPEDLAGARVLDAGAGTGAISVVLAERGADVVAADISPSLLRVAEARTPAHLLTRIDYRVGDMLDPDFGRFDYVVAMDSLIHYRLADIAEAIARLTERTECGVVLTTAPKTPLLSAMHTVGKVFPKSDRSPAIQPISAAKLRKKMEAKTGWRMGLRDRISKGFYISQAWEVTP